MENLTALKKDLRNYFLADRYYDGSATSANGRNRCLMAVYGSLPYGIRTDRFVDVLLNRPTWCIDTSVNWCIAWVERELLKRPKAPQIF